MKLQGDIVPRVAVFANPLEAIKESEIKLDPRFSHICRELCKGPFFR